jgi:hypothetical protein
MKLLTIFSSLLLLVNTTTSIITKKEPNIFEEKYEEATHKEPAIPVAINDIVIYEVEEEAVICFDTMQYLPKNFNALKGKNDINWSKIDLIDEPEEELTLDFNTKDYLPKNFNALQGKDDIDWSKIDLIDEPEEELIFDFNTKDYLPKGFDANHQVVTKKEICTRSEKL